MARTRNLALKPEAKLWLDDNPNQAKLFHKVRRFLRKIYITNNDGYVNFADKKVEYRFNGSTDNYWVYIQVLETVLSVLIRSRISSTNAIEQQRIYIHEKTLSEDLETVFKVIQDYKIDGFSIKKPQTLAEQNEDFYAEVKKFKNLSDAEIDKLLAKVPKKSKKTSKTITYYARSSLIVAFKLKEAKGVCQGCKKDAPFDRATDDTPYLEVHHIKPLSKDGEDSVENTIALCPNCHRQRHFG